MPIQKTELHPELLGATAAANATGKHNSASRKNMWDSHSKQAQVLINGTPPRIQTGVLRELGKFTFDIKMPCDALIIKVIEKYPKKMGYNRVKENPELVVIYEDIDTKQVGILIIPKYHTMHVRFGFKYRFNQKAVSHLREGQMIPKDTLIATTPNKDDDGEYGIGIEAKVAYMTLPQTIEDGFMVRRGFLESLKSTMIDSRVVQFGKEYYPLNLYGDKDNYKPFPDIGDKIREDGIVFGLRKVSEDFGAIDMTVEALMEIDYIYDELTYGEPGATVFDINSTHDKTLKNPPTPLGMEVQPRYYMQAHKDYYDALISIYNKLRRQRNDNLNITPEFHRCLVEAYAADPKYVKYNVQGLYKLTPLDDWRVEIKYTKDITPTIAYKITDSSGG